MKHVQIAAREIGDGRPVFLVIETGTTCNGKLDIALRMVDAARTAGADAIKFQMIGPEHFMSDRTVTYEYEWAGGRRSENMYEMFKGLEFPADQWRAIRDRCRDLGIIFYTSVDYMAGVDLAEEIGVAAYKIGSWDIGNLPLARKIARTGKPVQIDLGPATLSDIETLMEAIRGEGNDQIVLVHCSHATTDDGLNVRSVPYLAQTFGVPVGYSADTRDFVPDLASVALGTHLIEKRLTLDRSFPGHHHVKALEPEELTEWVGMIRRAEQALGEYAVKPSAEDRRLRDLYFVSLVAGTDIRTGTILTEEMLACKRPGNGIAPEHAGVLVGRAVRRDLRKDEMLTWDVV